MRITRLLPPLLVALFIVLSADTLPILEEPHSEALRVDEVRKVPKEKKKPPEKEKPSEDTKESGDENRKPDEKPAEPPPKKNCRKVPYQCGTTKECFDGNNTNCIDTPVFCTKEECD